MLPLRASAVRESNPELPAFPLPPFSLPGPQPSPRPLLRQHRSLAWHTLVPSQECFLLLHHLTHAHSRTCLLLPVQCQGSFLITLCLGLLICEMGTFSQSPLCRVPGKAECVSGVEGVEHCMAHNTCPVDVSYCYDVPFPGQLECPLLSLPGLPDVPLQPTLT